MHLSGDGALARSNFEVGNNILSRLIPILLLFALVLQTGFKVVLYLDYQVNKETITQKYCENKAKPEMKCHGKCHLKKQLKEEDKRNSTEKNNFREQTEISPFHEHKKQTLKTQTENNFTKCFFYLLKESEKSTSGIFHPPTTLL